MYVWIYNKVSLIEVVHKVVDLLADHYTRVSRPICCHVLVQRLALAIAMMTAMVMLIYVI